MVRHHRGKPSSNIHNVENIDEELGKLISTVCNGDRTRMFRRTERKEVGKVMTHEIYTRPRWRNDVRIIAAAEHVQPVARKRLCLTHKATVEKRLTAAG